MYVVHSHNADNALYEGLNLMTDANMVRVDSSRNGPVLRFNRPLASVYEQPRLRVLFAPTRENNPFFSLFESLWMLAGRNDLAFVNRFVGQMAAYSDDGVTLNGAYGHRWRKHFGVDQLEFIINELSANPNSRRAHLSMWDAAHDVPMLMNGGGKDFPCNVSACFDLTDDLLSLTVYNRSNDLVWGAYGANLVHFSFLQEYVACALGVGIGAYTQVSNNAHIYTENPVVKKLISVSQEGYASLTSAFVQDMIKLRNRDGYNNPIINTSPLLFDFGQRSQFESDLEQFFTYFDRSGRLPTTHLEYKTGFFRSIVQPMATAFEFYRDDLLKEASDYLDNLCEHNHIWYDWLCNAGEWLDRRITARAAKEAKNV